MDIDVAGLPILSGLRVAEIHPPSWEELPGCPICGEATALVSVAEVIGAFAGAALAACTTCEHLFHRRRPRSSWFASFYARTWDARGRMAAEAPVADPTGARFCAGQLVGDSRILDAGAGLGHAALGFRELGYDVVAAERSEHRAERLESLGFRTYRSTLEELELEAPVDLVHINHVLEHVDDPHAALTACARLTNDEGMVYVAVPNWLGEHALQSFHYVPHLTLFSIESLTRLLRRSGFEPVRTAVDRELRVLARKGGRSEGAVVDPPRTEFEARLETWAAAAIGTGHGPRTAVWWSGATDATYYDRAFVYGRTRSRWAAAELRLAGVSRFGLSRLGRRLAPAPVRAANVRAARIVVGRDGILPIRVTYGDGAPPVWIK